MQNKHKGTLSDVIAIAAAVLLFVFVYILPLGLRAGVIPDEFRYTEIPREMIDSGDWIVPHLDGMRYFEKPAGGYWLIATSLLAFGENMFAGRLPSALSVGVSALLIGLLLKGFGYHNRIVNLASVIFMTFFGVFGIGTFNVLDSMFSAAITATLVVFFLAHREAEFKKRYALLAASGALCGAAFLIKGFVAFALVGCVVVPFLIWERNGKGLWKFMWLPALSTLAVCLPWSIAVAVREPDFWRYFFWVEHIQRFTNPSPGQHDEAGWYYLWMLLACAFPWSLFLVAATAGVRILGRTNTLLRFAICWAAFPFMFFSMSSGKLGTYILPCYPPLAMLMSIGIVTYLESGRSRAFTGGALVSAALALVGALILVTVQTIDPFDHVVFGPSEQWKYVLTTACLVLWSLLSFLSVFSQDIRRTLLYCCIAPVSLICCAPALLPTEQPGAKTPGAFIRARAENISPTTVVVSDRTLVHALCWCLKRNDVYLFRKDGELKYGLGYVDAEGRMLDVDGFNELVGGLAHGRRAVLFLTTDGHDSLTRFLKRENLAHRMPKPVMEIVSSGLWMGSFERAANSGRKTTLAPPGG